MLRALPSPSSPVLADTVDVFSLPLFSVARDLQKESPHCNHTITKCARSKSRMPGHMKQRRVIFPVLHTGDFPSPRSTIDCISEISEVKKDLSAPTCNLTLNDIALSHANNSDFKSSHMLPLSPLLSREQLTRLGLDCPSRLVPGLPFAPRIGNEVKKPLTALRRKTVQEENEVCGTITGSTGTYAGRATQPSSSRGRRSILPVRVSPLRGLSPSIGSESFNSDISSVNSEREPVADVESLRRATALPSILRPSSYGSYNERKGDVEKVSSVASDIPSLASSDTSDTQSPSSNNNDPSDSVGPLSPRPISNLQRVSTRDVVFDARILVREFSRSEEEALSIWYTAAEMHSFKLEASKRIMAYTRTEIIPTGTGRMIERPITPRSAKALFSHAALQVDSIDLPFPAVDSVPALCLPREKVSIKKILIVDPYDICLQLFAKTFQHAIPNASIVLSRTSDEALRQVSRNNFDLAVVEERLKLFHRQQNVCGKANASGSLLLQRIAAIAKNSPVLVGVSAHLPEDADRLKTVGKADLLWTKPPPPLSRELLTQLDGLLKSKRGCKQTNKNS